MIEIKKYKSALFPLGASLVMVVFIFSNSLASSTTSNELSSGISYSIRELLASFVEIDADLFHVFVRKAAHFTEFAVLGVALSLSVLRIGRISGHYHIASVLFVSLLVAVLDEFIQSFTGRTSAVSDVLIDFSGAVFGFIIVCAVVKLKRKKTIG